jgi:hypothetical protein
VKHFTSKPLIQDLRTDTDAEADRRRTKRHPLRSRALVGIPGQPSIRGTMLDMAAGSIGIALPIALTAGTDCMVFFTVTVEGQLVAVSGAGTVTSCICRGVDGFRIGMRFSTQDAQAERAIDKLLKKDRGVAAN